MAKKVLKKKATKKKTAVKKLSLREKLKAIRSGRKFLAVKKIVQKPLRVKPKKPQPELNRHPGNPIITPKPHLAWESKATFNPAAVQAGGKVHLLYRAIGDSDRSVLGYASSVDGVNISERLPYPVYLPREAFEGGFAVRPNYTGHVSPYMSGGGGWGGVEDPRMTRIGTRIYMFYVAYNGWQNPRVAMTSISVADFLHHQWNWSHPVLVSQPHLIDKNACLLPEKVNGKYVIFHRVFPDILIDYVDSLNFSGKDGWLKGEFKISPRKNFWDSRKIGAGAPPIKTSRGWLLIYQAVGDQDSGRYKIGAMLLDLNRPERVIARCAEPVLVPEEAYENNGWKSGVVYPCGAAVLGGQLYVYYGGADYATAVATAPLEQFVDILLTTGKPTLRPSGASSSAHVTR